MGKWFIALCVSFSSFALAATVLDPILSDSSLSVKNLCSDLSLQEQIQENYRNQKPFDDPSEEETMRKLFLRKQRMALRKQIAMILWNELETIEQSIAPFASFGGTETRRNEQPIQCEKYSRPSTGAPPTLDHESLRRLGKNRLWWSSYGWNLVAASFEIQMIRRVLFTNIWQTKLWPEGTLRLEDKAFPSIISTGNGDKLSPEQRLGALFNQYPILKRPLPGKSAKSSPGNPKDLADYLFLKFFSKNQSSKDPLQVLLDLLVQEMGTIRTDLRKLDLFKSEADPTGRELDSSAAEQKLEIFVWNILLNYRIPSLVMETMDSSQLKSDIVKQTIYQVYSTWQGKINHQKKLMCKQTNLNYTEEIPKLTTLFFQRKSPDRGTRLNFLDVMCNTTWGQTNRKKIETYSELLTGMGFVASVSLGKRAPKATKFLLPLTASLSFGQFLSRGIAGLGHVAIEDSTFSPSRNELRDMKLASAVNFALAPLSAAGIWNTGSILANSSSCKSFLPIGRSRNQLLLLGANLTTSTTTQALNRIKRGLNPLKDRGFWITFATDYIQNLLLTSIADYFRNPNGLKLVLETYTKAIVVGMVINHYVQNFDYILSGVEIDKRIIEYSLRWSLGPPVGPGMVVKAAQVTEWYLNHLIFRDSPLLSVTSAAISIVHTYFVNNLASNAYLRFMQNRDLTFWQAVLKSEEWEFNEDLMHPEILELKNTAEKLRLNQADERLIDVYVETELNARQALPAN